MDFLGSSGLTMLSSSFLRGAPAAAAAGRRSGTGSTGRGGEEGRAAAAGRSSLATGGTATGLMGSGVATGSGNGLAAGSAFGTKIFLPVGPMGGAATVGAATGLLATVGSSRRLRFCSASMALSLRRAANQACSITR